MTLHITFQRLEQAGACRESYLLFRRAMQKQGYTDENVPIPLMLALGSNGLKDTLWALMAVLPEEADEKRRIVSLYLADVLERVESHMTDKRSRDVIPLLRQHARYTLDESVWDAARVAAWVADGDVGREVWEAARAAAWATEWAAARTKWAAAWAATWAAAWVADGAAAWAEEARAEAREVEKGWQTERLRWYLKSQDKKEAA